MNLDLNVWDRLTRVAIFLIFVAFVCFIGKAYLPLIQLNERMRQRILALDAQTQKAEEVKRQINLSFDALRFNPKAVERVARERLGYAKPGETVIRFENPSTNTSPRL